MATKSKAVIELTVSRYEEQSEWWVCMHYPLNAWLAAFNTQRAAKAAVKILHAKPHWCLQPDKLAKLPEVKQVNIGVSDY